MKVLALVLLVLAVAVSARHLRRPTAYPVITYLPDPFTFQNGTRITSLSQWYALAAEQSQLIQKLELGVKEPVPTVVGTLSGSTLTVKCTYNSKSISFTVSITTPSTGTAPYPAVIGIGVNALDSSIISKLGIATMVLPADSIAAQDSASSRGVGLFYDLYGSDHSAGAMMAWAWGLDCLVTALEQVSATAKIDTKHLATTGCSRDGKGAMITGLFVDRIKLIITQESGSGGADSWRVSDWMMANGIKTQTLSEIVQEDVWFTDSFKDFSDTATQLPFDHHTLAGLAGPDRGVLFIENTGIDWLGGYSGWVSANAAHKIFEAFGKPDSLGFTGVSHQDHCTFQSTQGSALQAFLQKFLLDQDVSTKVMTTQSNSTIDASWIPWTVPVLSDDTLENCVASAVDLGSSEYHVVYQVQATGRKIESVQVVSNGHTFALSGAMKLEGHTSVFGNTFQPGVGVQTPFTLEVKTTDGAVSSIEIDQFAENASFADC